MKIYAGQTLEGTMVFTDDDGSVISDFSGIDIKLLVKNVYNDYSILVEKASMQISGEQVKFTISPGQTKKLTTSAVIELKVTRGAKVLIAKKQPFVVESNTIKDL